MTDVSNRFLAWEILIPFVVLAIGGLISWGSLSADMDHKAEKTDVAVLKTEVTHIKEDVQDVKEEQKKQRELLEDIKEAVTD